MILTYTLAYHCLIARFWRCVYIVCNILSWIYLNKDNIFQNQNLDWLCYLDILLAIYKKTYIMSIIIETWRFKCQITKLCKTNHRKSNAFYAIGKSIYNSKTFKNKFAKLFDVICMFLRKLVEKSSYKWYIKERISCI